MSLTRLYRLSEGPERMLSFQELQKRYPDAAVFFDRDIGSGPQFERSTFMVSSDGHLLANVKGLGWRIYDPQKKQWNVTQKPSQVRGGKWVVVYDHDPEGHGTDVDRRVRGVKASSPVEAVQKSGVVTVDPQELSQRLERTDGPFWCELENGQVTIFPVNTLAEVGTFTEHFFNIFGEGAYTPEELQSAWPNFIGKMPVPVTDEYGFVIGRHE